MPGFSALKKPMTCFDFVAEASKERKAVVFSSSVVRKHPAVHYFMRDKNSMFCGAPAKDYCFIDHHRLTVSTVAETSEKTSGQLTIS